jgi:hypothetical protein
MRRQAVNWFRAINIGGPNGRMVPGVTEDIDRILGEGSHFILLVPADLSKTGKAYYGLSWAGQFHAFTLTPDQARRFGLKPGGVQIGTGARRSDVRRAQPLAQLDRLQIDNAARLPGDKAITGTVVCHLSEDLPSDLVLRFAYKLKGSTVFVTKPVRELPPDGVLKFSIDGVNKDQKDLHFGPMPVFVDLCLENGGGFDRRLTVVSNTLGALLDVRPAPALPNPSGSSVAGTVRSAPALPNPSGSSVAGTVWKFGGTDTTVEFLPGGRVRFSNSEYGGNWTQEGRSLRFDSNGFTLFEVQINGDEMSGTWRRLRGDDIGLTSPTSLQRVSPAPLRR